MGFDEEGFSEFSRTQGTLSFEAEGKVDENEYRSANYWNKAGTIGYSAVEIDGNVDYVFVSRTLKGVVLTMPADGTGPVKVPIEGYHSVATVKSGSPVKEYYEMHIKALGGEVPLPDRPWFEKEVPILPKRALEVTMKMFEIACKAMEEMMGDMGKAMGEAVGQVADGMGKAMGDMMEGVGKAMGEAMEAAGKAPGEPAKEQMEEAAEGAKDEEAPPKKNAGKAPPAGKAKASKEPKKGPSGPKKKKK